MTADERRDLRFNFVEIGAIDLPRWIASRFAQRDELRRQLALPKLAGNVDESPTDFRVMYHH